MTIVSIQLDNSIDTPLYQQIALALKEQIEKGLLSADTKLPPIRRLAEQLGINNSTVVAAYRQLVADGYAYSKIGSGTFVRHIKRPTHQEATVVRQIQVPDRGINFASATPTPEVFPVADFKRLINQVLDRDGGKAFGYQESQGYYPLRESLTKYLADYHITTTVDHIHVISGAQQGIDLVAKALVNHGDTVIVESPTYQGAIASFLSRGANIVSIPMQPDGPELDTLENVLRQHRPRLFYTMPHYHNPTGYSYSTEKKRKLLQLAEQYDFMIAEDDYLSELSFSGRNNLTLKALDQHDRVIYIKSFSKILMPGLRMGLLVTPLKFNAAVIAAKQHSDISTSGLLQRTFDLYLREHIWQKNLAYMRQIYLRRYSTLVKAVKKHFPPEVTYHLPQGGLHLWFKLPSGLDSTQLFQHCRSRNVLITPGSYFAPDNHREFFRICYAATRQEEIENGIAIIAEVLKLLLNEDNYREVQPLL